MAERNPNLISPKAMEAIASTAGSGRELISEIFTKINNAKDKPKKIEVLRKYNTPGIRMILKGAFDPNIEWLLPKGEVPYRKNEAPIGTDHTLLSQEAKRLYMFTKGGDNTLSNTKRETLFIQILEGLSAEEADFLVTVVNKKVNNKYKGFTANLVKEAFNWDDNFMKKDVK